MTNSAENPADHPADYEDLPTGALRDRVSSLSADELQHLIDEETLHDNRTPVIDVLKSRLAELQGGDPTT
jgi:PHD/YefM family antitoxin component YafN of YafNO toxin-antitoxin module